MSSEFRASTDEPLDAAGFVPGVASGPRADRSSAAGAAGSRGEARVGADPGADPGSGPSRAPSGSDASAAGSSGPDDGVWRGLLLVAGLTVAAVALARLPGLRVAGPLVVALAVGTAWRAFVDVGPAMMPGIRVAAKPLLKVGIALLGVRLDLALLASAGGWVVAAAVSAVFGGVAAVAWIGRRLGVPRALAWAVAVGTAVCGASAVVAAVPLLGARDEDATVAVGVVSLLGTAAALGFVLLYALVPVPDEIYALLVGGTLQEVAQVVAAGYSPADPATGDLALVAKLSRVALLAPLLVWLGVRFGRSGDASARRSPVPAFLIGFALLGALASVGWIPEIAIEPITRASLALTAAAMTAIGLLTDLRAVRRVGRAALLQGAAGYLAVLVLVGGLVALRAAL